MENTIKNNYNESNDISNQNLENKRIRYIQIANECVVIADSIAQDNPDSFLMKMASQEVFNYAAKSKASNCEYTAYVNANSSEKWLEKMVSRKF